MPVGTTRKRERGGGARHSPEREHVYIVNPAAYKEDDAKQGQKGGGAHKLDENAIEKMKFLKEKYGDASALGNFTKK